MASAQERQEFGVYLVLMRSREAMGSAGVVDILRALDEPRRFLRGVVNWHDLIVFAVQEEGRNIELLQIFGEVSLRERLDALVRVLRPACILQSQN